VADGLRDSDYCRDVPVRADPGAGAVRNKSIIITMGQYLAAVRAQQTEKGGISDVPERGLDPAEFGPGGVLADHEAVGVGDEAGPDEGAAVVDGTDVGGDAEQLL